MSWSMIRSRCRMALYFAPCAMPTNTSRALLRAHHEPPELCPLRLGESPNSMQWVLSNGVGIDAINTTSHVRFDGNIVRAGVNYHFN